MHHALVMPLRGSHFLPLVTYAIPQQVRDIAVGDLVEIPMGNKREKGIVAEIQDETPSFTVKNIGAILRKSVYSQIQISFIQNAAQHFFTSPGTLISKSLSKHLLETNITPPVEDRYSLTEKSREGIKGKKQLDCVAFLESQPLSKKSEIQAQNISTGTLNMLLKKEIVSISQHPQYIHKTEKQKKKQHSQFSEHIFLGPLYSAKITAEKEFIEKAYTEKGQVLILFPDSISLKQSLKKYKNIFPEITEYHASQTGTHLKKSYWEIATGNTSIIFGTLSSLFLPFHSLSAIMVFEYAHPAHHASFAPFVHLPTLARIAAQTYNVPLLLSSSSGDISTVHAAHENKTAMQSFAPSFPVQCTITDMKLEIQNNNFTPLAESTLEKMREHIGSGKKVAVYLNRKGMHTSLVCTQCGDSPLSPLTGNRLAIYKDAQGTQRLRCGSTGYIQKLSHTCAKCNAPMKTMGEGTQFLEGFLQKQFPNTNIIRMDKDSMTTSSKTSQVLEKISDADIIIGTQMMLSCGPIEKCSLVIDVLMDNALLYPSFIGEEKLWIQYALEKELLGKEEKREIIIQTFQPESQILQYLQYDDFIRLYTQELKTRKHLGYPPFASSITFTKSGKVQKTLETAFAELQKKLHPLAKTYPASFSFLPHRQMVQGEMQCFFQEIPDFTNIQKQGFQIARLREWG